MKLSKKIVTLVMLMSGLLLVAENDDVAKDDKKEEQKVQHKKSTTAVSSQLVDFKYDGAELQDILNDFAQKRNINLIYPETDSIKSKITFDAGRKLTMLEAWDFLIMILDQAGFTLVHRNNHTYFVMATKKALKESVPLYINVDYNLLPETQEKLRYVYYFNTIQVSKQLTEVKTILTTILGSTNLEDKLILDSTFNTAIFTCSAEMIKAAMRVISEFDETGLKDAVQILKLEYCSAAEVVTLLTSMIGNNAKGGTPGFAPLSGASQKAKYFSDTANVINLDPNGTRKLNSIVIMGKAEDVDNIKSFIKKYLDVPQQQGKSFYHVIELDWLDAANFVQVLQNIVQGQGSVTGQSTGTSGAESSLQFDPQIKIIAEKTSQGLSSGGTSSFGGGGGAGGSNTLQRGGNRLIIAAPERDWHRIQSIIKQVDIPQKQVVIEALVVDLDLQFIRRLGSQIRTRGLCPAIFPKDMQAQAGLLFNNVINDTQSTNAAGNQVSISDLSGDLSAILGGSASSATVGFDEGGYNNLNTGADSDFGSTTETAGTANTAMGGLNSSTVFMLSDGRIKNGVWAFFQLLSTHKTAKILTRPVLIATNNKEATLSSKSTKNLATSTTAGTSPTINYSPVESPVTITFTPIISANNIVNLQMNIQLSFWLSASDESSGAQNQRNLTTNISMNSGDVVILGGLIKEHVSKSKKSIPFIEKIPLVGSLAANRFKDSTRDQLFILIRPTVVEPRKQGGMGSITKNAAQFIEHQFTEYENAFSNLRDPITRWFFNEHVDKSSDKIDNKLADLNDSKGLPINTLPADTQQEKEEKAKNPLSVGWLSDATHSKKEHHVSHKPEMKELENKLQAIANPFASQSRLQL